ncbi:cupin domain-containing protein [Phenylobacterium sp. LjRoot225]|uniref:cupin domain-containing protein n=1 Tax=Phenylobacterium sp. LjRoot225 TaxID=3342285 RepID=UPI003F4FE930
MAQGLFGWPQLNAALAEQRLTPPRLRLERAGGDVTQGVFKARRTRRGAAMQDLDPSVLMDRLREGATLIVDAVNEISPPLQQLCSGLSAEFTASSQANLYACWGTTQGFDVHWDDHDVFVVQIEGCKEWALYGATEAAPTRRGPAPQASPPTYEPERIVLEPGDVLYLPRGYWHAAVGLGGPTLHLTIGLTRKTGSDLLHWLADDLLAETLGRADLPFEAGAAAVGARIAEILAGLAARDPEALARSYRRHVEAMLPQRPGLAFPYIGDETLLAPTARISLAQGPARLERNGEDLVLSWRGVEFTLAPVLESPLRRLLAGETLSAAVFADAASEADVQAFLRDMVRRGAFVAREEED